MCCYNLAVILLRTNTQVIIMAVDKLFTYLLNLLYLLYLLYLLTYFTYFTYFQAGIRNKVQLQITQKQYKEAVSTPNKIIIIFKKIFSVPLLSVLRGHSVFSSPPQRPMTSDFERFSIPDFIHYIYFPILIFEKEPVFSLLNVQC